MGVNIELVLHFLMYVDLVTQQILGGLMFSVISLSVNGEGEFIPEMLSP